MPHSIFKWKILDLAVTLLLLFFHSLERTALRKSIRNTMNFPEMNRKWSVFTKFSSESLVVKNE